MGFTTPCFIRKNTEAPRKKLEEVGYKMLSPIEYDNLECSDNWVNDIKSLNDCNGIDCGTNEELFLALAALRDDTDKFQWFISPEGIWVYNKDNDSILEVSIKWRKATVDELIEHFKIKEE